MSEIDELRDAASHIKDLIVINEAIAHLVNDYNERARGIGLSVQTRELMVASYQEWVLSQISIAPPPSPDE